MTKRAWRFETLAYILIAAALLIPLFAWVFLVTVHAVHCGDLTRALGNHAMTEEMERKETVELWNAIEILHRSGRAELPISLRVSGPAAMAHYGTGTGWRLGIEEISAKWFKIYERYHPREKEDSTCVRLSSE